MYGAFVWARRALSRPFRRLPARAVSQGPHERKEFKGSPVGYPNYYAYSMGPVRFVVISTEHCGSVKCIMRDEDMGNAQMMWLEQELMMANQNWSPEISIVSKVDYSSKAKSFRDVFAGIGTVRTPALCPDHPQILAWCLK